VSILKNKEKLSEMSAAIGKHHVSNAASDIADMILSLYQKKSERSDANEQN
jgi:UDP-N-acetylglucosamine:LPS N-acetylglucosamine transferase